MGKTYMKTNSLYIDNKAIITIFGICRVDFEGFVLLISVVPTTTTQSDDERKLTGICFL